MEWLINVILHVQMTDTIAPGRFVRISRKRQAEMDELVGTQQANAPRPNDTTSELDFLPAAVRMLAMSIRRFVAREIPSEMSPASLIEIEANIEQLKKLWQRFETSWEKAMDCSFSPTQMDESADFYSEIMDSYLRRSTELQSRKNKLAKIAVASTSVVGTGTWPYATTSSGQVIQIQLAEPPKVPKFSGNDVDWANFQAQFEAEVHNNIQLSNAQKLRKLLNALEGRAKQAIGDWPTTDERSYGLAWQALCRQYGNDYNTISAHMQKIFALKVVRQPSAEALREILDTTRVTHRQLSLMLTPEKVAEYILLHRLEWLMDAESQSQWAIRRTANTLPTLTDLYEFLEIRASLIAAAPNTVRPREDLRASTVPNVARVSNSGGLAEIRPNCYLCSGERHFPYHCAKFKALTLSDRHSYAEKHKLCLNCFSLKHATVSCHRTKCPRCYEAHNSTLCPRNQKIDSAQTRRSSAVRSDTSGNAALPLFTKE